MVKNIVINKEIMDIVNKYVEVILANYKVKAIILFGSYAKGTNHEDSVEEYYGIQIRVYKDIDKYFSNSSMENYLSRIEHAISNVEDKNLRNQLLNEYNRAIVGEQEKFKACKNYRKNGQISGIDFDKTIDRIKNMHNNEQEVTLQ